MITLLLALQLLSGGDRPKCFVIVDYAPRGEPMGWHQRSPVPPPPPLPQPPPPPAPLTTIRLHGSTMEYKLAKRILPAYPKSACAAGLSGTVRMLVTIARDGSIRDAKVVDGDPGLNPAALSAIKQWHYSPTLVNGNRVEVKTAVSFRFETSPPHSR